MNLKERSELNLKFMLATCDVRLQVLGPTPAFPRALYNILSIQPIRHDDGANDKRFPNMDYF